MKMKGKLILETMATGNTLVFALLLVVGLVMISAVSCSGGGSPTAATKAFMTAFEKGDLKGMEKVSTPETMALMGPMMEKMEQQKKEEGDSSKSMFGKITYSDEKIDGDTATVMVTFSDGDMKDNPSPMTLKKVGGKWLVDFSK